MYSSHIFWLLTFVLVTPMTLQADSNAQVPPGLREAYQQVRQQIEVIEEKGKPIRWHAVNAGNHLNVDFDGKGIEASSPKDDWSLSMELTQLGAVGQLKSAINLRPILKIIALPTTEATLKNGTSMIQRDWSKASRWTNRWPRNNWYCSLRWAGMLSPR